MRALQAGSHHDFGRPDRIAAGPPPHPQPVVALPDRPAADRSGVSGRRVTRELHGAAVGEADRGVGLEEGGRTGQRAGRQQIVRRQQHHVVPSSRLESVVVGGDVALVPVVADESSLGDRRQPAVRPPLHSRQAKRRRPRSVDLDAGLIERRRQASRQVVAVVVARDDHGDAVESRLERRAADPSGDPSGKR